MKRKRIIFPEINRSCLVDENIDMPKGNQVLIKTYYSTVSPGTERANITGDANVAGISAPDVTFPRGSGYSSAGIVAAVGNDVKSIKVGDRVIVYWGLHTNFNLVPESQCVKITEEGIDLQTASCMFISTFPLAALRKTRLEIGESCLVMGLGLLGQFAVRLAKAAGAVPVIAVDLVESRREDALKGGADYALDPRNPDFVKLVKEYSDGGVNTAIEVTGQGAGLDETLDCMAQFGRVALLGCTRDKNFTIDYYRKVHCPGITLIGAHTKARPMCESHAGYFTHEDDLHAVMKLESKGRIDFKALLGNVFLPEQNEEVYSRLINDRNFPMLVQFDWTKGLEV